MNLKQSQATFQKTIMWTKKSSKKLQEWKDDCIIVGLLSPGGYLQARVDHF
jgi:hypothetical protein